MTKKQKEVIEGKINYLREKTEEYDKKRISAETAGDQATYEDMVIGGFFIEKQLAGMESVLITLGYVIKKPSDAPWTLTKC